MEVSKITRLIRSHEWWEYKLPPLLALGYATALSSRVPLYKVAGWLVLVLLSVIVGAIYVSVINDITDIREDLASGKANRMAGISPGRRWIIPVLCLAVGLICISRLYPDSLSKVLYFLPWLSFSLYSFPPVRLKNRGGWGVVADALGSHVFISLLIVSSVSVTIDWIWFVSVGVWAFAYGVRGILWHQFMDRDNDLRVHLDTYATRRDPASFRTTAFCILMVESIALGVMLWRIANPFALAALLLYFVVVYVRHRKRGYAIVVILSPGDKPFQIWMADYYHLFLPLSLLAYAAIKQPWAWVVLVIHVFLFPGKLKWLIKDLMPF